MVDAATVLSTHLTELIKSNVAELLSYAEVQKLIKDLPKEQSELIKDIVPAQITVSGIQRVLQLLLAERVSIRDLGHHPGGHRRRDRVHAQSGDAGRARAGAARAPDLRPVHHAGRPPAADRAVRHREQAFAESIIGQGDDRTSPCSPRG